MAALAAGGAAVVAAGVPKNATCLAFAGGFFVAAAGKAAVTAAGELLLLLAGLLPLLLRWQLLLA